MALWPTHFSREVGRIDQHKKPNYAIDHEVNALLKEDGFKLPEGRHCTKIASVNQLNKSLT